ncbi:MAG: CBS domain-containing protein [Woeseiaceae bacterium]
MRNETIDRIMTVNPATVAPGDLLATAAALFESAGVHHAPVVDSGELVGILSATDFLKLHLLKSSNVPLEKVKVRQLMQTNPVVLPHSASLRDAAEKFMVGEFHALPVIDDDGALTGIITTSDLVQYVLQHVPKGDGSLEENTSEPRDVDEQTRRLKAVCKAAEHYIRSGHADREHSVLVKRLDELRSSKPEVF